MGPMPEQCNGLKLLDDAREFCKFNCLWVNKKRGRIKKEEKPQVKKMKEARKRDTIKKPQSICLVMEKDQLDFIKTQALQRSVQEGRLIEANQLIREALSKAFPTPKQFDMFGARL